MTGGLFAILDDIALLLDDAAVMSKVAVKKTAGVLGDDLAVNAEKATGFSASRELPVLWAITKGSFVNKLIILPLAFLLSAYLPILIIPILLLGGAYLSFEGVEKIYHLIIPHPSSKPTTQNTNNDDQLQLIEKEKIRSAIRTDFILSIEIIMIALGTVMEQVLLLQIMVVSVIAVVATIGVYGIVAMLIRMDDVGFFLLQKARSLQGLLSRAIRGLGMMLIVSLPHVIRALGIIGTVAMLIVGGGMFTHNIKFLHHATGYLPTLVGDLLLGLLVGSLLLFPFLGWKKLRPATVKSG